MTEWRPRTKKWSVGRLTAGGADDHRTSVKLVKNTTFRYLNTQYVSVHSHTSVFLDKIIATK